MGEKIDFPRSYSEETREAHREYFGKVYSYYPYDDGDQETLGDYLVNSVSESAEGKINIEMLNLDPKSDTGTKVFDFDVFTAMVESGSLKLRDKKTRV